MVKSQAYIFRQCITLRNGQRICKPPGQAFRIPIGELHKSKNEPKNDN
jgi:hypothetical protein